MTKASGVSESRESRSLGSLGSLGVSNCKLYYSLACLVAIVHYGSVICQAFIQKLALWLYWYWVLGIGLPGYSNYIYYMVDMW